jgi:streptomycin 6-kinase
MTPNVTPQQAPPAGAATLTQAVQLLTQLNARLIRIETRQARQLLDAGMPLHKDDHHANA